MVREIRFLFALWKANLLSAMEYRIPFISQVLGMMLNNAVYFVFWIIFFERFENVGGWGLSDIFVLFGIVATAFGMGVFLFGNTTMLARNIASGRLDYYLSLPRPVLLHHLASRSVSSGLGDFMYGLLSFAFARQYSLDAILRFIIGAVFGAVIFVSFLTLVQCLAFWVGNASLIADQATNAIITFALYPITLFDGTAKLILFTLIPAALVGSVPAEFVRSFSWAQLFQIVGTGVLLLFLSIYVFYRGLRRYESGSAFHVQM
jgi:viologen exporter family transport system permease protein